MRRVIPTAVVILLSCSLAGAFQVQITVTPPSSTALPATVNYALTLDDPNVTIANVYWDFGDGGRSLVTTGTYTYVSPGTYPVTATVEDSQGTLASASTAVTLSDPTYPTLTLDSPPSDPTTVSQPSIPVSGSSTGAQEIRWSTDRGEAGLATGTDTFNATVPLHPGRNRLLLNAFAAGGQMTKLDREIRYYPADPLAIVNVQPVSASAERWEPFVVNFDINNTRATIFDWPYDPNPPPGVAPGLGITVNGEFSDDGFATTLVQPAFYYQPVQFQTISGKDWLAPTGQPYWVLRFAPPRVGTWQYRIVATDAGGNSASPTYSFEVTAPTNPTNHGFVRPNPVDTRYFRYDDGTHYLGIGHNEAFTDVNKFVTAMSSRFAMVGSDAIDFLRIWMSTSAIFGCAWAPLNSATLPYVGYVPATGLAPDQAYADGQVSVRLDSANPDMFYGWMGGDTAVISGHTYRIRVRVKLIGVTGPSQSGYPYGFTIKKTGWPNPPANFFPTYAAILPHRTGSCDWSVVECNWTATGSFPGDLSFILENATAGTVFIDEISIREILAGGLLGPERNRKPKMNHQTYFDGLAAWQYDYLLDQARQQGIYYRVVLTERNDYILTHLGKHGFFEKNASADNFNALPGTASYVYQSYWWRYVTARWGAQRSVHSYELVNEQDPWNAGGYVHTQDLAAWMHANDPTHRSAITSFWNSFPDTGFWKNPAYPDIDHADVHAYLFYGTPENTDTAYAHWVLGRDLASRGVGKPITRGETGILGSGWSESTDLRLDTTGVWLHNLTWAQLDADGMSEFYWYPANIRGENVGHGNLYNVYRVFRSFMSDIPLGNGHYVDAAATSSNTSIRVVGQYDPVNGRGHLWINRAEHTWRNVVDNVQIAPITGTVTVPGLACRAKYNIIRFDTYTGAVLDEQTAVTPATGLLSLTVQNLTTDIAIKIDLVMRLAACDFDQDGDVDMEDFGRFQACLTGPYVPQNDPNCVNALLDADTDVDQADMTRFRKCLSGAGIPAAPSCAN